MKILVVSETFSRGGLETQIKTYYDNLPEEVEMVFAFANTTGEVTLDNAKIYTDFHFSFNDTVNDFCEDVERLVDIIEKENINVIHAHPFYSFFAALFASQITQTKLVYTYHGFSSFNFLNTATVSAIFKYAFESGAVAQLHAVNSVGIDCFEAMGYRNNVFIPNPIDTEKFQTVEYVNNKKWAIISRIDSDKLVEIKELILNKDKFGMDTIDIYGNGAEVEALQQFLQENQLSSAVQYKGYCNDVYNTIHQNYNGIVGIGRVILEGLAMGIPVFMIGYGKLTGFINKELYDEIYPVNFTNFKTNRTNFEMPNAEELHLIQKDVKERFFVYGVIKTYVESINSCESIYLANFKRFYFELKALANNTESANYFFTTSRAVYKLVNSYVRTYSIDNSLNNMFITTDLCYYSGDDLSARVEQIEKRLEQEITDLRQQVENTFVRRVINKIKRIVKYKEKK